MTIGVFDSGIGAHFVAERLRTALPGYEFLVVTDETHVPYGDRRSEEIVRLVDTALQPLLERCRVIVLACNTATAVAIDELRVTYPDHHFVGFEPMIKPAAELSDSGIVTILATDATRKSARYRQLVESYGSGLTIIEPDTDRWASLIQVNEIEEINLDETIASVNEHGSDVIALACTHYLILEKTLRERLPYTTIIEPTPAVTLQLTRILAQLPQQ